MKKESFKFFLLGFSFYIIFFAFVLRSFYPIHYEDQGLLFFELIAHSLKVPFVIKLILALSNPWIIFQISKRINPKYSYLASLVFCLSPWSAYLLVANSFYLYLLTFVLLIVLGLTQHRSRLGKILIILSSVVIFYSSLTLGISLFIFILISRAINLFKPAKIYNLILLLLLPLIFLSLSNQAGIKSIFQQEIFFLDQGEMNLNNQYQGQSQKGGFSKISKISENKYEYLLKYGFLKISQNLLPQTYFTSQEKLLKFSLMPPLLLGFILPFSLGFYL
ncbi:hypothetical protein HY025_00350 [Candidatus Daviesbacteria bacterium]|nr:hypothetical protein [Candidatus Daviesbacteria bacterium]